jgi:hypothetical protein
MECTLPVMNAASSESRKQASAATSAAEPALELLEDRCLDGARRDCVDADAVRRQRQRRRARQPDHGVLAGAVGDVPRRPAQSRGGGDVHHRPAAALAHRGGAGAQAEPRPLHVDREHAVEALLGVVERRPDEAERGGVVHEQIDAAEALDGLCGGGIDLRGDGDVGGPRDRERSVGVGARVAGHGGDRLGTSLLELRAGEVEQQHSRAFGDQSGGGGAPDAGRGARHERDLALEAALGRALHGSRARLAALAD